jgi:hypothetical protein
VITDLRSANGVHVGEERIRICDREFTFEIAPREHG